MLKVKYIFYSFNCTFYLPLLWVKSGVLKGQFSSSISFVKDVYYLRPDAACGYGLCIEGEKINVYCWSGHILLTEVSFVPMPERPREEIRDLE